MKFIKFIIPIIFIVSALTFAQGSIATPYDTTGWDPPNSYSTHYSLRIFTLLSNPGGGYNRNMRQIDSLMYALVVFTDTNQLAIVNDTLVFSDRMSGIASFTGTDQVDTLAILGFRPTDILTVSVRDTIPTSNDLLGVYPATDTAYIKRAAAGISGLTYSWIWVKK